MQARSQGIRKGGYILRGSGGALQKIIFNLRWQIPQNLMISSIAKEISDVQISSAHDGIASSQALPALKVAIDDECSGKGRPGVY